MSRMKDKRPMSVQECVALFAEHCKEDVGQNPWGQGYVLDALEAMKQADVVAIAYEALWRLGNKK